MVSIDEANFNFNAMLTVQESQNIIVLLFLYVFVHNQTGQGEESNNAETINSFPIAPLSQGRLMASNDPCEDVLGVLLVRRLRNKNYALA